MFTMVQADVSKPQDVRPRLIVFARVGEDEPLAAFRTTPESDESCTSGDATARLSDGAFTAVRSQDHAAVLRVNYREEGVRLVGRSEIRALNSIEALWPSDDFVVGLRAPPIALVTWDAAGREVVFTGPGSDLEGGPSSSVTVLEPWTYWIQAVDFVGTLMRRSTDGRVESLDPFPGTSVFAFWSGGETAIWFTSVDRETGTADLWSGAYDEDPNRWEPRRLLRTSEDIVGGLGGENTFAVMWSGTPIRLSFFHLGRRTVRELVLPEDMVVWADPVYVSDTEVMLRDRFGVETEAYRFDLTALPERALDEDEPE